MENHLIFYSNENDIRSIEYIASENMTSHKNQRNPSNDGHSKNQIDYFYHKSNVRHN